MNITEKETYNHPHIRTTIPAAHPTKRLRRTDKFSGSLQDPVAPTHHPADPPVAVEYHEVGAQTGR
jgi:hypothetical protein